MAINTVVLGVILFGIANGGSISHIYSYTSLFQEISFIFLLAASDDFVRNFKVVSSNVTYITFSWDMQSGYESTSNISSFRIFYASVPPGSSGFTSSVHISTSSTTQTNGGLTFSYTTTVTSFSNAAQYIMWLYVYRSTTPTDLYSKQIYVEIGEHNMYI